MIKERLKGQEDVWQLICEYSLSTTGLVSIASEENFVYGFELGVKLILDVLMR